MQNIVVKAVFLLFAAPLIGLQVGSSLKSNVFVPRGASFDEVVRASVERKPVDFGLGADWLLARWQIEQGLRPTAANQWFQATLEAKSGQQPPDWWQREALYVLHPHPREFDSKPEIVPLTIRNPFAKIGDVFIRPPKEFFEDSAAAFGAADSNFAAVIGTDRHISTDLLVLDVKTSEVIASISSEKWCPSIFPGELRKAAPGTDSPKTWLELSIANGRVSIFGLSENTLFFSLVDLKTAELLIHFFDVPNSLAVFQYTAESLAHPALGS